MTAARSRTNEEMRFKLLKVLSDQQSWQELQEDRILHMIWNVSGAETIASDDLDDDVEDDVDVTRPLLEVLGIDTDWASEESAPPTDDHLLEAFLRHELSREESDEVLRLIARYRSWHSRYSEIFRRMSGLPEQPEPDEFDENWIAALDDDSDEIESRMPIDIESMSLQEGGPPVDDDRILALARKELPLKESRELVHLIVTYRPWIRGLKRIIETRFNNP